MNSRKGNAPTITADQVAAALVIASKNGTVRMLGVGSTLADLAQHLLDQDARLERMERLSGFENPPARGR
jgi:hypothetical protein